MTIGTIYHPGEGGLAAYDDVKGVHPLLEHEEYDDKLAGTPDRNVRCDDLNLGTNHTQTVNSLFYGRWGNCDIGAGSTLKIASGALIIGSMGKAAIGTTPGAGGTIDFGTAEGVIWSAWVTPYGDITIGANIAGSGGLTKTANGTLALTAANSYTGKTCIASGCLYVGDGKMTNSKLGEGDVEVANGAVLRIKANVANAIADTAVVTLWNAGTAFFGTLDLEAGINETVGALVLDGKAQPAGTYGSKASGATFKLDNYFTGPGVLTVTGSGVVKP
jgi:autotransporter-associated beta strand protein